MDADVRVEGRKCRINKRNWQSFIQKVVLDVQLCHIHLGLQVTSCFGCCQEVLFSMFHKLTDKGVSHLSIMVEFFITSDFSSRGLCAAHIITVEFCWHVQQTSVIGFITVIKSKSFLHSVQNVLYAVAGELVNNPHGLHRYNSIEFRIGGCGQSMRTSCA